MCVSRGSLAMPQDTLCRFLLDRIKYSSYRDVYIGWWAAWQGNAKLPLRRNFDESNESLPNRQLVALGMGCLVFCSFCVLFAAYLAWHLGALARTMPQAIGAVGWILLAY